MVCVCTWLWPFVISTALDGSFASSDVGGVSSHISNSALPSWCGIVDFALLGHVYNTTVTETHKLCREACRDQPACVSSNFASRNGRRCELSNASHLRYSDDFSERPGWVYTYSCTQGNCEGQPHLLMPECGGHARVTEDSYQTQKLASAECHKTNQHLCELWEVDKTIDAGYTAAVPLNSSLWYAVPDSQAVVSGIGVAQHGLPVSTPSPGLCCLGRQLSPQDPFITSERYGVLDRDGMEMGCSALAAHLCTLAELKAAYLRGYRQPGAWLFYAVPNRDALLLSDGCGSFNGSECYEGTVVDTARPVPVAEVYCCPNLYCFERQPVNPHHPFITRESYFVDDRDGMASGCCAQAAHLCTLAELKAAYLSGYRPPVIVWAYYAVPDRDAKLFSDGCSDYTGSECYEGIVANTPRPYPRSRVYCCP